jgi:hypothetical protein
MLNLDKTGVMASQPGIGRRLLVQKAVGTGLVLAITAIFLLTTVYAFGKVGGSEWANTKELLELLLPAETALLGAAIGFYFGTQQR